MALKMNFHAIGRRVAGKRTERGLTQRELADAVDVSQRTICLLETGRITNTTLATIAGISWVLGESLDQLVYGDVQAKHG